MSASIEDLARITCEELPYLGDTLHTEHATAADYRYAGMTDKEIAKCERWVRWAALKAELAAIHAEIEGRIPMSSIC